MGSDIRLDLAGLLPRMRRFAYALTGDINRAEDVVQEAYARAFAHLEQFQQGTRLSSWMYRIVRNVWLNEERALRGRGTMVGLDAGLEAAGEDGRTVTETRLTLSRVLDALSRLPREQQELIALVCIEGLSYQEAAEVLEIPLGTATSRLARGRRTLFEIAVEGSNILRGEHDQVN